MAGNGVLADLDGGVARRQLPDGVAGGESQRLPIGRPDRVVDLAAAEGRQGGKRACRYVYLIKIAVQGVSVLVGQSIIRVFAVNVNKRFAVGRPDRGVAMPGVYIGQKVERRAGGRVGQPQFAVGERDITVGHEYVGEMAAIGGEAGEGDDLLGEGVLVEGSAVSQVNQPYLAAQFQAGAGGVEELLPVWRESGRVNAEGQVQGDLVGDIGRCNKQDVVFFYLTIKKPIAGRRPVEEVTWG